MSDHSFPALGFDPAPGDTVAMDGLAADCTRFGNELQDDVNTLNSLKDGYLWSGPAATAFLSAVDVMPQHLQDASDGYLAAGKALHSFSTDLAGYQTQARALETEAAGYAGTANTPPTPTATPGPAPQAPGSKPAGPPPKTPQQIASGQLDDVRKRAHTLRGQVQDSAGTASSALGHASSAAPHKPGWFSSMVSGIENFVKSVNKAVGDFVRKHATIIKWVADLASKISSVLSIAAALCAFVPVLGEFADAVLVPLALATGAVALAGHTLLAVYAGGSWTDVALDAAGLVTGGAGKAIGRTGEAAETAEKAAAGAGGVAKGGTATAKAAEAGDQAANDAGKVAEAGAKTPGAVSRGATAVKNTAVKAGTKVKTVAARDLQEAKDAAHDVRPSNFKGAWNKAMDEAKDAKPLTGAQLTRKMIGYHFNFPAVGLAGNDLAHSGETGQDAGEGVDRVREQQREQRERQLGKGGVVDVTPR